VGPDTMVSISTRQSPWHGKKRAGREKKGREVKYPINQRTDPFPLAGGGGEGTERIKLLSLLTTNSGGKEGGRKKSPSTQKGGGGRPVLFALPW